MQLDCPSCWALGRYTTIVSGQIMIQDGVVDSSQVPRKILHPKEYQEFELKEKTIISSNTAM
jgi:hypothetical protein